MAFAVESVGQLILNIGLFTGGMAFGILAIVLAISRSMTKNRNHWAIIFSMFAWTIALIIPQVWYSALIFGFGAFALSLAFMPIVEKTGDKNIFILAIIAGVLNLLLLLGTGAYDVSLAWQDNYDDSLTTIENVLNVEITNLGNGVPEYEVCSPNSLDANGEPCESDVTSGTFNENLFVPFASVLTIGQYIGKAVAFIGMTTLAPIVLSSTLISGGYFTNVIIVYLMGFMIAIWQMAIFYKLIAFVLDKRGMR